MTTTSFTKALTKLAKAQAVAPLATALAALVAIKQAKPAPRHSGDGSDTWGTTASMDASSGRGGSKPRRSARRVGLKLYTATDKWDASRRGTFRKYMIATIRAHSDTWDATSAHSKCDNPKFAKNKLDFNWAADNGYITFI